MKNVLENPDAPKNPNTFTFPITSEKNIVYKFSLPKIKDKRCWLCEGIGRITKDLNPLKSKKAKVCESCFGTGRERIPHPIPIGIRSIDAMYIRLMETLPGFTFVARNDSHETAQPFRFDGGDGLIMPMRILK